MPTFPSGGAQCAYAGIKIKSKSKTQMLSLKSTTHSLYKGHVRITFDPSKKRGRYEIEDMNELPMSVTEIVGVLDKSFALMYWQRETTRAFFSSYLASVSQEEFSKAEVLALAETAIAHPEKVKNEAKETGNEVHEWLHKFAKAKMKKKEIPALPENPAYQKCISGFLDWYNLHEVVFLASEKVVYSREHNYVGTLDAIAMVDDKLTLVDYKTSAKVYPGYLLQIAGYQIAYNEEKKHTFNLEKIKNGDFSPSLIEHGLILHLDKENGKFLSPIPVNDFSMLQNDFWHALSLKKGEKQIKREYRLK